MKNILLLLLFLSLNSFLLAQPFTDINAGLVGVGRSSVAWADFDLDGDLDMLISGNQGSGPYVAEVYRNDNGNFTNINAGIPGFDNSSVAWGDYDNDGDPDILATGRSTGNIHTWLYRNDNGSFSQINAGFPDIGSYGAVAWGDIDGDGDLDALISGNYSTSLFQNNNGVFTNLNYSLPGVSNSSLNILDLDNDGDLDLFIMGDAGGWPIAVICRNDEGNFTILDSTGILPLSAGSSCWTDYDNDKDLDILVTGFDQYLEPKTSIFTNDGALNFTNAWPGLPGAALGTGAWGDYDNDGDADIVLTGQNAACGSLSSLVFRNDGNNNFTDINAPLDGAERGSAAWADYDNDGDLDIVISGFNGSGMPSTKLYQNTLGSNTFSTAVAPTVPVNLNTEVTAQGVVLRWDKSTDNHTLQDAITYNLRIGTSPGQQDIYPSNSDPSGFPLLFKPGNLGNSNEWNLFLPDGTYYWTVQSQDHGFKASDLSEEQMFTISTVGLNDLSEDAFSCYPNPFVDNFQISCTYAEQIEIINLQGTTYYSGSTKDNAKINSKEWPSGVYIVRLKGTNRNSEQLIIKK